MVRLLIIGKDSAGVHGGGDAGSGIGGGGVVGRKVGVSVVLVRPLLAEDSDDD